MFVEAGNFHLLNEIQPLIKNPEKNIKGRLGSPLSSNESPNGLSLDARSVLWADFVVLKWAAYFQFWEVFFVLHTISKKNFWRRRTNHYAWNDQILLRMKLGLRLKTGESVTMKRYRLAWMHAWVHVYILVRSTDLFQIIQLNIIKHELITCHMQVARTYNWIVTWKNDQRAAPAGPPRTFEINCVFHFTPVICQVANYWSAHKKKLLGPNWWSEYATTKW
jgi:hypothetical protein